MHTREPIHVGSGAEPIVMLHPFLCSQNVWRTVADQLADTGRFEVFAPTMVGHNGGTRATSWFMDTADRVDDVERRMDQLGWDTGHIVGNSLGGWVAFELERRGRARTLTAIAPAGGWSQHSATKYETVLKFLLGGPALIAARLIGPRIIDLPFVRRIATLPVSGPADGPSHPDLVALVDDATHCAAYVQLLVKTLRLPGLLSSPTSRRRPSWCCAKRTGSSRRRGATSTSSIICPPTLRSSGLKASATSRCWRHQDASPS